VATWTKAATAARLLRKIADRLEADGDELLRDVAWRTPWGRSDDE
jgi:translation initiation factor 2 alpha subunit (eIF-2alpha)